MIKQLLVSPEGAACSSWMFPLSTHILSLLRFSKSVFQMLCKCTHECPPSRTHTSMQENTVLLFFLVSCLSHLQPPLIHDMFRLQLKELSMVCICTLSDPGKDAIVLHSAAAARIESLGCHKEVLVLSSTGTSS